MVLHLKVRDTPLLLLLLLLALLLLLLLLLPTRVRTLLCFVARAWVKTALASLVCP